MIGSKLSMLDGVGLAQQFGDRPNCQNSFLWSPMLMYLMVRLHDCVREDMLVSQRRLMVFKIARSTFGVPLSYTHIWKKY